MQFCAYGCGREGKYLIRFKGGVKWCCKKQWRKCPNLNKKETIEIIRKKLTGIKRSKETKKLMSDKAKERYENKEEKIKHSKLFKKIWADKIRRQKLSDKQKLRFLNPNERDKHSKVLKAAYSKPEVILKTKRSIEKIKNKYPIFYNEEEMRYNPTKPEEKEIQVHCKNHNCPNSKEQGGWFTPDSRQIELRIYETEKGNNGGHFYCCEDCKIECPLYNSRGNDPYLLKEYEQYKKEVIRLTEYTIKKYKNKIERIDYRSVDYPLDHKFSIYKGFINNIKHKYIAHYKNLEIVDREYNSKKQDECSLTIEEFEQLFFNKNIYGD